MYDKEIMQWSGFNLDTGAPMWGPTASEEPWNFYSAAALAEFATIGYGRLFTGGYAGILTCYDLKSGNVLWTYNNTYGGFETPYGNYPLSIAAIADGKIYLYTSEHSPNVPPYKGVLLRCVNVTDGKELWTLPSWLSGGAGTGYAVADGYFAYINLYDMQVYSIGKGPSATTVSGPQTALTQGQSVVITGSVTDQSAGAKVKVQSGEFSSIPAVSDQSIGAWMQYVYMQKPIPSDAKGVSVKVTAVDPNGNFQDLGTPTTDTNGNYGLMWIPPVPGLYQIKTSFAGSESYGPSTATTYIGVDPAKASPAVTQTPAPTVTTPVTPTPTNPPTAVVPPSPTPSIAPPPTGAEPTATYIAICAAVVVIVAVAAALILRRRK
jgi:outer membrane protein assembly factor BamB